MLHPVQSATASGACAPELTALGASETTVSADPKPAALIFKVGFLESARGSVNEFTEVARYSGQILLRDKTPVFACDPNAGFEYVNGVPEERFQSLDIVFTVPSFETAPAEPLALQIAWPEQGQRYAELGIELEVAGVVEGTVQHNGRYDFDVRRPGKPFDVQIQDEDGAPLPGANVIVSQGGVTVLVAVSDAQGTVHVEGHSDGLPCFVTVEGRAPLVIEGGPEVEGDGQLTDYEPGPDPEGEGGCDFENTEGELEELEPPPDDLFA